MPESDREADALHLRAQKAEAEVEKLNERLDNRDRLSAACRQRSEQALTDAERATERRVCEELAEEFELRADLPVHRDTMQLRSGMLLDAAALCRRWAR